MTKSPSHDVAYRTLGVVLCGLTLLGQVAGVVGFWFVSRWCSLSFAIGAAWMVASWVSCDWWKGLQREN